MSDSGAPDAAEAASELKRKRVSSIEDETEEEQPDAVDVPSKSPFKAARVESADYKSIRSKYLDTMAEESEEDAAAAADGESDPESDSDDEAELGSEIPDEMKGFIVDKVDDDEVSVESDVSDVEYDPDVLDDDDLALIAENTGAKFEQEDDDYGAKQLRRLKKGSAVAKRQEEYDNWLEDEYIEQGDLDLSDIWATVAECFGDVDLVVQILKNERTVQPREEAAVSDYESEYVEPATQEVTLESLADPDELAKEYMTKQDEAIREHDEPERLYIRYRNRPRHTDDREIKEEAQWIARRLISEFSDDLSVERVRKMYDLVFRGTYPSPQISPEEDIREKCEMVLVWLLNERWEVPFILHHKRHLICPPLTDDIVWRVYHLDAEWIKLKTMAERIKDIIDRIGYEELPNDVLYYALNFNTLEDLQDVNGHLRYHHRKAMYEETPVEDQPPEKPLQPAIPPEDPVPLEDGIMGDDIEDEDDVFGDFAFGGHTLETTADPQHFRSPSSVPISPMSAMSSPLDRMDDPAEPVHGDAGPRILPAKKTSIIPPDSPAEGDPFDETNQEFGSGDDENHDLSGRVAERDGGDNGDVDDGAQLDDDDDDDDTDHHADNREGLDMSADDLSADEDVDMDVDGNQRSDHAPAHSTDLLEMDDDHLKDDYEEEDDLPDHRITEISTSMKSLEVQTTTKRPHMKQRSVDMHLIDTIEKGGFHELWRGYIADARQFATVLEKSLTPGSTELRIQMDQVRAQWKELGVVGMLDAPSIIEGSEEQQVEDMCAQFCRPPYSGGKRLYTALVSYHTKMLAHNITIRRLLREYYRNYCSITCTTTTKGEAEVDVADASWPARRLYRMPLRELTTYRQVHYSYPTSATTREERYRILDSHRRGTALAEMYLQIVQLEKEGAIKCTIHPICAQEVPAWKADGFGDRFAEWYERYKVVTYSGNQLVSESYRTRMGEQKAILEKEEMLLKDAEERDKQWRRQLLDQLVMAYCPSNVPTYSIWRHIQKEILSRLINVELIPKFRMEIREELWRNAQSFVLLHCQRMLQYKLDVNPSPSETVLALAVDAEPQRVYATVVNEFGDMKDYKRLDRLIAHPIMPRNATPSNPLFKEVMEDIDVLCDMVANFRISVVLVAMSNTGAVTLYNRLETYMVPNIKVPLTIKKLDVEVPRLRVSMLPRATVNDLCLSMARWYIDPVAETLNLWSQNSTNLLLKLNLHPFQHVISQEKLQEYLECTLVHMVCHFGVDINRVKNSKHLEATLQFVAGLGPRKTMDVLRLLKIAAIGTRSQLRMGQAAIRGLGELVFYNCASFIKISSNEAMDILDTTRLHPVECYYTAEKLCTDSLDYDLGGEEAIQEIFNNPKRLDDLDLEAYSSLLMEKRNMPRMLPYLLFVKHELQSPFHDYRADLQELRDEEEFCLALQIDHLLLRRGAHVMCRLEEVYEHTIRACVLPLELKAHVVDYRNFRDDVYRISKEQNRTIQLRGICISARVSNVEYAPNFENGRCAYRVEVALTGQQRRYLLLDLFDDVKRVLGIREDHLSPLVHFDVNYSKKPMLNEHSEKHKIHYRRVIRHPSYRMWPLNKIVAFLKQPEIGIGECCICPMSEWDRLNLVIKTCAEPFNCATFVIHERNQRVPGELGKELILLNQTYTSIDQIIAQFCETLKLNLEEIYMHPKFKHSTDISKAERDLIQESAMRPDGIAWAILPPHPMQHRGSQVRYNPLRFTLLVMPPSMELTQGARSLQDSIYVDHRSFKLWTHHEKSLASLIKWWKQVGYWNRNRHRELYNQEKAAMMRQGAAPQMRH